MKKTFIITLAVLVCLPACRKEDIFSTWRDPSKTIIKSDDSYFTVVHYNIWGADTPWNSQRFDDIAAVINSQKPDFVTLNEVDSLTRRNKFVMFEELAKRTGMNYAFARAREPHSHYTMSSGAYGDAVLSKFPIQEVKRFKLYPDPAQGNDQKEDRSVCAVRADMNGRSLWIASTHLDHRPGTELSRLSQAEQLEVVLKELEGPLVLGGDLNAGPTSLTMQKIFTYMNPLYPSLTPEYYTAPSKYDGQETPSRLIDYLLVRKEEANLRCISYRIVNSPASDHCAVVATFKFIE